MAEKRIQQPKNSTLVLCPGCDSGLHAVELLTNAENPPNYIRLTCRRCNQQLQFVVDLLPGFNRHDAAATVIRWDLTRRAR